MTMDTLTDRVAIVTGAASGLGRMVAEVLAEAEISGLMIADVNAAEAEHVAADLSQRFSCEAIGSGTDVSKSSDIEAMVRATVDRFGRIDILVNNAGIAPTIRWSEVTEENWRRVMDVNLNGAFLCTLAVLPIMQRQQWGRIVNISSLGAFVGSVCAHPAYGVSKAGMIAMTKSLAKTYALDNILVNAIAPGSFDTPLARSFGEEQIEEFKQASPLKRQGTPRELADAVFYLVSNRATYVTGATLHVNGGALLV